MRKLKPYLLIFILFFSFSELYSEKEWVKVKDIIVSYENYHLLDCLDSNNCYAIADFTQFVTMFKSSDQGKTWFEDWNKDDNESWLLLNLSRCQISDSNHIYLNYTDRIGIDKTDDGGKTFEQILFGKYSENKNTRFFDIVMFTNQIGAGLTRKLLIHTDDNWETHNIIKIPDSIHARRPIFFVDSNNIVFNRFDGYNANFIKYDIKNRNWSVWGKGEEKGVAEYETVDDVDFMNDSIWFAAGGRFIDSGQSIDIVWKTTDKGKKWIKLLDQLNEPNFGISRVAFRNEEHGIAVGNWGKILETTDGGESWFQYPIKQERGTSVPLITWAGTIPIITSNSRGIFRLETVTDVEELSSDQKFRVYQSGSNLEIAINDESHSTYSFQLFNSSGQELLSQEVKSSFGFVFEPVPLIPLTNGVYYYTISHINSVEFTGKLVVVE